MKPVLRLLAFIVLVAISNQKSNAQCTVSNIVLQNVKVIASSATSCTIKFDETFNILNNNGNKMIFIHAWLENDYPNYFQCVNGLTTRNGSIRAPEAADLGSTYYNIGIDNTSSTPTVLTSYPADPSVILSMMDSVRKIVLPDGSANFTLYGVVSTSPLPCPTPIVIIADLWSSQSSAAQRAHCVSCGIKYTVGYLTVAGFVNCATLRYNGTVTNLTGIQLDGYYRVFADVNGDEYFTPTTDTLIQSNTLFTVGAFASINISGSVPAANINENIFIVFTQTTGGASGASRVILFRSTRCSPLPVTFRSLTASRISRTNVMLRWETVTEINNRGFSVERNMGNNTWESVAFIQTQAPGGNSSSSLIYSFNDINTNKGITQYRIKQIDIDGKAKFSENRAVRGDAQKGSIIIYPNPSADGRITVVFEDKEASRDVILTDMNGRTLKQWKGTTNNTLEIENLGTGMYTLRVIMQETGSQLMEKIIVSRY